MRRKILASAFLIFIFLQCNSQSDFREGYIILNNNDTIYGSINYSGNKKNLLECVFIKESEKVIYHPGDLKAYRFTDGKFYISRNIKEGDINKKFLEFLIDGIVDLYYYYDNMGDHYLIGKNNSDLTELRIENITEIINNQTYTRELREYVGVLKEFFGDSPTAMRNAEKISLNANSLVKIAEDYHNEVCTSERCITYSKKKTKVVLGFGPMIGYSPSKISFTGTNSAHHFDFPSKGSGITVGAFLNLKDPAISEKLSLQLEIAYTKARFSSLTSTLDMSGLKIPLIVKYTFPFKKVKPSVSLGVHYSNILVFENKSEVSGYFNQLKGRNQYGLAAGIETEYRFNLRGSAFLQLRYEYLQGHHYHGLEQIGTKAYFYSEINQIDLLVGLKF